MTQINWKSNDHTGGFIERQLRGLEQWISTQPEEQRLQYLGKYAYLFELKARVAKYERELELEERIKELERLAGIAQQGVIKQ